MKRSKQENVEIPVTPMLDMAFQLLTFFILTYNPAPVEGQFTMSLLPPAPAIDMNAAAPAESANASPDLPASLRTLATSLYARPDGSLDRIVIGELEFQTLDQLRARLKEIVADESLPFDQAVIATDPRLNYSELIRVIDVFAGPEINMTKLSFSELGGDGGVPPI